MSNNVSSRNEWVFSQCCKSIFDDKDLLVRQNTTQMLEKSLKMFKYENLPKTIKTKDLETYNQVGGFSIWAKVNGELYVFQGGLGGKPNPYYLPTIVTVANPALNYSANLEIDKECIVMLNDYYYIGLMPMFNKYAHLLSEAELSLQTAIINARVPYLVQADNESTKKSAEEFLKKIKKGEMGIIASNDFFEGITTHDFFTEPHIKEIIESIQYIKGSWYNEIGINSTFNMKREAINEAEATLNEDLLVPFPQVMLECRQEALNKINNMFGTNITIDFDSVWKQQEDNRNMTLELEKANIELVESQAENTSNPIENEVNKGGEDNEETNRDTE